MHAVDETYDVPAPVRCGVCGGNRTPRGARTQQILASVLRTVQQRHLDATTVLTEALCAPQPRSVLKTPATIQQRQTLDEDQ